MDDARNHSTAKLMYLLLVVYLLINYTPFQSIPDSHPAISIAGVSYFKASIYHYVSALLVAIITELVEIQ